MTSSCALRTTLLFSYSDVANMFCQAVTALHDGHMTGSHSNDQKLQEQAEEAYGALEAARLALELHIQQHGCQSAQANRLPGHRFETGRSHNDLQTSWTSNECAA
jgi:hypothetical protein